MLVEGAIFALLGQFLLVARSRLKSRASLEAENLVLRQQVIVLSRKSRSRVRLRNPDRLIFVWLYRVHLTSPIFRSGEKRRYSKSQQPQDIAQPSRRAGYGCAVQFLGGSRIMDHRLAATLQSAPATRVRQRSPNG